MTVTFKVRQEALGIKAPNACIKQYIILGIVEPGRADKTDEESAVGTDEYKTGL